MTHQQAIENHAAERYLLDEMSELERFRFEEHFFSCDECAENMRMGHQLRRGGAALFGSVAAEAAAAAERPPRRGRAHAALPWAAAAVLALALVYQVRTPDPSSPQPLPVTRALQPVAIRPVTRGALPTVHLSPSADAVALSLDVNVGTSGDAAEYSLIREDDGRTVAAGSTRIPASGTPLLLIVPTVQLDQGFYTLRLSVAGLGAPAAEYRFNAAYTETGGTL